MSDEGTPGNTESGNRRASYPPGTLRVGSIRGVDVLIRSSWLLIALLLAWTFAPQIEQEEPGLGAWKYVAGLAFAVLFYLSLLLHEVSHALMAQRYGLGVRSITLFFLGGVTEIDSETRTPGQEFKVSIVGPLTSLAVGLAFLALLVVTPEGLLHLTVFVLAWSNLIVAAFNLLPGLPFDGGHVLRALVWRVTGNQHRGTIIAAWGGRVLAVLVLLSPVLLRPLVGPPDLIDYVIAAVLGWFLWSAATASMVSARVRRRLPELKARPLARRVIAVPDDLSVSEAVRRAREAGAGAIVVHLGDDRLSGIVNEAALLATPEERRAWVPVSAIARSIEDGLVLPADIVGEDLVRAITATPAEEYVLVETDGSIFGVLATADVDRAFEEGARR